MATAKGVIMFSVNGDGEPTTYYANHDDALDAARERSEADPESPIVVERCVTEPVTKGLIIRLANSAGRFVVETRREAVFVDGKRVAFKRPCDIVAGSDCAWYCKTHACRMGGNVNMPPRTCPAGDDDHSPDFNDKL